MEVDALLGPLVTRPRLPGETWSKPLDTAEDRPSDVRGSSGGRDQSESRGLRTSSRPSLQSLYRTPRNPESRASPPHCRPPRSPRPYDPPTGGAAPRRLQPGGEGCPPPAPS